MSCEFETQIHAYHDGELPANQRALLEAHLKECDECTELLADLRRMSRLVAAAPMADMPGAVVGRIEAAWKSARGDRGVLRIAEWLTGAAAAVLLGALLLWPSQVGEATAHAGTWQATAVMPPAEVRGDDAVPDVVGAAQWMANDLSVAERR